VTLGVAVAQRTLTALVMVRIHEGQPLFIFMIMIRRAVNKDKSYTVIFLQGEEPRWIPTNDYEHARILQIYKQDRYYEGIENDFTDFMVD
jgi:hypothetical protein